MGRQGRTKTPISHPVIENTSLLLVAVIAPIVLSYYLLNYILHAEKQHSTPTVSDVRHLPSENTNEQHTCASEGVAKHIACNLVAVAAQIVQ